MFVFSREPIDLSQKPPIESIKKLLKLFEKSAQERGENTIIYKDPDHKILADNELVKELNKILKDNPDQPVPDGFRKVKIQEFKPVYKVPSYMEVSESKKIALEVLDELLSDKFGFHLFEPIHQPFTTYKAKPALNQLMKYPVRKKDVPFVYDNRSFTQKKRKNVLFPIPSQPYKEDKSPMNKSKKGSKTKRKLRNVNRSMPAERSPKGFASKSISSVRKRLYNEITPELGLNLRLEVVKYPFKERKNVQEVAETLEEILEAASKGLTTLPPRKKYGLHRENKVPKKALIEQQEQEKKKKEYEIYKVNLNKRLNQMKEKRAQQVKEDRLTRKENEKKLKQKEERKKKKYEEDLQKRLNEAREKKKAEETGKSEDVKKKIEEEVSKRKEQERKRFMRKQRKQMNKEFNELSLKRKNDSSKLTDDEKEKLNKKGKETRLKSLFKKEKQMKAKKEEMKENYKKFLESEDIQKVLDENFEIISEIWLKYCKEQKYTTKKGPEDFKMNFTAFKKFGHDMKIYPNLIAFDQYSQLYKTISKEKSDEAKKQNKIGKNKINDKDTLSINFQEFKDSLLRICCLSKD